VEGITLPPEQPWAKNVYWMYSILVEDDFGLTRDELMQKLFEGGIETRPFFNPIHLMPPYKSGESFPVAEELARKGVNLPSSTSLRKEEITRIASLVRTH
jgi:perosamine synthetase